VELFAGLGWLAFGPVAAAMARNRDRDVWVWLVFGCVIGPAATAILLVAPPGSCGMCMLPVRGWTYRCGRCGHDVRDVPDLAALTTRSGTAGGESSPLAVGTSAGAPDAERAPADNRAKPERQAAVATRRRPPSRRTSGQVIAIDERRRPATRAAASSGRAPESATRAVPVVLASGVFVGGTLPLLPGARYSISADGANLEVTGPVDIAPTQVAVRRSLSGVEASIVGDRLIIADRAPAAGGLGLVFTGVVGAAPEVLERRLSGEPVDAGADDRALGR
jgi:hypothetical protein